MKAVVRSDIVRTLDGAQMFLPDLGMMNVHQMSVPTMQDLPPNPPKIAGQTLREGDIPGLIAVTALSVFLMLSITNRESQWMLIRAMTLCKFLVGA
jgi:hypothetical protein